MKVLVGGDHGGFEMKNELVSWLSDEGYEVVDMGPEEYDAGDDYPDIVVPLAKEVADDSNSRGVVICRNGVGVSIAVNKVKGIRGSVGFSTRHVETAREHDDLNVLALPADYVSIDEAKELVRTFLETSFSGDERHVRRLGKVAAIEL